MTCQRVGSQPVSTRAQRTDRQRDGIALDRVLTDHLTGATRNRRPALDDLRHYLRDGDTVVEAQATAEVPKTQLVREYGNHRDSVFRDLAGAR